MLNQIKLISSQAKIVGDQKAAFSRGALLLHQTYGTSSINDEFQNFLKNKKLKISAPRDPDEQQKIGRRLQSADQKIFALENELHKLKQQKSGLMYDLLTGKVHVKLVSKTSEMAGG